MISRARTRERGFTFLEIALALAIVVVVFIATLPLAETSLRERRLRSLADSITDMVAEQRTQAGKTGRAATLRIQKSGFERIDEATDAAEELLGIPKNTTLSVRFLDEKWAAPDGRRWEFSPAGMVTPLSIRVAEGGAYIEQDYDFLTGRVADERFSF
jgi:type II secretory pathway pseudopilin PulG